MTIEQSCKYHFQSGNSDKVYHIQLVNNGGLYEVHCQYGRRGSTLASANKTKAPVPYDKAITLYQKARLEREKKGYALVEYDSNTGAAPAMANMPTMPQKDFVGLMPHLLAPILPGQIKVIINDFANYCLQQKHDGHRRGFILDAASKTSVNKKGFSTPYPAELTADFNVLESMYPLTVDGELVGDHYFIFDVRTVRGENIEGQAYEDRLLVMDAISELLVASGSTHVSVTKTAYSREEKQALFDQMVAEGREGVVAKNIKGKYEPGLKAKGGCQFKFKLVKDVTCIVLSQHETKSSIALGLLDAQGQMVGVGNCTIPQNVAMPSPGDRVDISYLYAFEGGSLYQPVFRMVRNDEVDRDECTLDRLQYKDKGVSEQNAA